MATAGQFPSQEAGFDYNESQEEQQHSAPSEGVLSEDKPLNLRVLGDNSTFTIGPQENNISRTEMGSLQNTFPDFMKQEKVKLQPVLLCLGDMDGAGGRKEAMQQMLETPIADGFSPYHILASKKYYLADVDTGLKLYNYGFQSYSLFADSLIDDLLKSRVYEHELLKKHMNCLRTHLKENKSSKEKVMKHLTKGVSLIKIWDLSVHSNAFHFLRYFSGFLTNSRLWLFAGPGMLKQLAVVDTTESSEAAQPLESPAAKDNPIRPWNLELDYLLRSTMICNNSVGPIGKRRKPCKLFFSCGSHERSDKKRSDSPQKTESPTSNQQNETIIPPFSNNTDSTVDPIVQAPPKCTLSPLYTTGTQQVEESISEKNTSPVEEDPNLFLQAAKDVIISNLEEDLSHIARQLKVSDLMEESVIDIQSGNKRDSLQSYVKRSLSQTDEADVPISWLFLRGALEHRENIFMNKEELHEIAKECGIEEDFEDFCGFFTSFGSIFDISLKCQSSKKIVIIKPDEFLSKVNKAFDIISSPDEQGSSYKKDGIITSETATKLFGAAEGKSFMTVFVQVGIAATIPTDHDEYYYMPCARKLKQQLLPDKAAVKVLLNIQCPTVVNYEVSFTECMLNLYGNDAQLQSSEYENVTIIKLINGSNSNGFVTIIYRGDEIEVKVEAANHSSRLDYVILVLRAFQQLAQKAANNGTFAYAFATKCKNDYHLLDLPNDLCEKCQKNEDLQIWAEALKQAPIQEEFKFKTDITPEDISFISSGLETCSKETLISFSRKFLKYSLEEDWVRDWVSPNWLNVMCILTNWMTKEKRQGHLVTKAELARKIRTFGNENNNTEFQIVGRRLLSKVIQETNTLNRRPSDISRQN
ncbi:PREDICTED: uncharacterized protein LOC109583014 [Amphimedon queenslandica]|uniref:Uncharacterized protein n=1 Tax=Amphimedon queenslandica TaxID=400682 RepID=A0A1X7UJS0_AMPQE|nr:PREDICTED: uncharacterized protein LOC109583014 [Amphimedon queenslandica]|eukprot:XP_019853702.1 PREDICTED: uncharacterized protein LOC109583014 [Amphimedon queenslandica]